MEKEEYSQVLEIIKIGKNPNTTEKEKVEGMILKAKQILLKAVVEIPRQTGINTK